MTEIKDIDSVQLTSVVNKLLDKAGMDARLTPRLLREKAEQRMKLEPGRLISKKTDIMNTIVSWWMENQPTSTKPKTTGDATSGEVTALQSLSKYAKAVGKGPHFFKELNNDSDADKAKDIRRRLHDDGFEVSAVPSTAEIEQARKKYELKKELSDMDPSNVLTKRPRKQLSVDDEKEKNEINKLNSDQISKEKIEKGKDEHFSRSSIGSPEREKENVGRNLDPESNGKKAKLNDDILDEEEEAEAQF